MIILYVGPFGSGKTRGASGSTAQRWREGLQVYSNIHLAIPHKRVTEIDLKTDISDCVLLLDEIHLVADSRRSGSNETLNWTYLFTQTRKARCDVIGTTQDVSQVDVRFRNFIDLLIVCEAIAWELVDGEQCATRFRYTAIRRDGYAKVWEEERGEEVKLYNSWEVVHKQTTTFTKQEKPKKGKVVVKKGKTKAQRVKGLDL